MTLQVHILDVGHGSCVVAVDGADVTIIDAGGCQSPLAAFLFDHGLNRIRTVLLSHSDSDHFMGLQAILSQPGLHISEAATNSDPTKETDVWENFAYAMDDAVRRGTRFAVGLSAGDGDRFSSARLRVEIVGPLPSTALLQRRRDASGRSVAATANSRSAVIRLSHGGRPLVLVCGDMDQGALGELETAKVNLAAEVLVWPHHGGWPGTTGSAAEAFAERLCRAVAPAMIVFSFDRERYRNPRTEIVRGIRKAKPDVWIACTQLSQHCSKATPGTPPAHVWGSPKAFATKKSCAGSVMIDLLTATVRPPRGDHAGFVGSLTGPTLCKP